MLQNPLANIKAIMTDNAVGFDTGDDDGTSYDFQFQSVYAIEGSGQVQAPGSSAVPIAPVWSKTPSS